MDATMTPNPIPAKCGPLAVTLAEAQLTAVVKLAEVLIEADCTLYDLIRVCEAELSAIWPSDAPTPNLLPPDGIWLLTDALTDDQLKAVVKLAEVLIEADCTLYDLIRVCEAV